MRGHGERKPHIHAARIPLHWCVQEFLYFGKSDDFVEFLSNLLLGHSKDCAVQIDILSSRQLRMKPGPDLQQAGDTSTDNNSSSSWLCDSTEDLEKCALASTVKTND